MAERELLLQEAALELDVTASKVYQMGTRGELVMRFDDRFKKWMVTAASVAKAKREIARGA